MLKKMCRKPPWSQLAVRIVYHRPPTKTGPKPLAPKRSRLQPLGIRKSLPAAAEMFCGSATSENVKRTMQVVSTSGVNPRSRPSLVSVGANPHSPAFQRPQLKHRSSLTPTRLPQDGQTTEPH